MEKGLKIFGVIVLVLIFSAIVFLFANLDFLKGLFIKPTYLDIGKYNIHEKLQHASKFSDNAYMIDLEFSNINLKDNTLYEISFTNENGEIISISTYMVPPIPTIELSCNSTLSDDWSIYDCDVDSLKSDARNIYCEFENINCCFSILYHSTPMFVDEILTEMHASTTTNLMLIGTNVNELFELIHYLEIKEINTK